MEIAMTHGLSNRRRGEVVARIGGEPVRLRLTLGALAELETAFSAGDLAALAARFARGMLSARDLQAIVTVAMRGAGRQISDAEAAELPIAGELPGLVAAVAELLALTFGEAAQAGASHSVVGPATVEAGSGLQNAPVEAGGEFTSAPVEAGACGPFLRLIWRWAASHFPGMR